MPNLHIYLYLRAVFSRSVVSNSLRPMDCSAPGSSVHGVLPARILECVARPSSRGSSRPRDPTHVSRIAGRFFTIWATRKAKLYSSNVPIGKNSICKVWYILSYRPPLGAWNTSPLAKGTALPQGRSLCIPRLGYVPLLSTVWVVCTFLCSTYENYY